MKDDPTTDLERELEAADAREAVLAADYLRMQLLMEEVERVRRRREPSITTVLRRLRDQAERIGERLGKPVDVVIEANEPLRLPHEGWESLWNHLVHVVRNAIDHGVEPSEERIRWGKPTRGRLTLTARPQGQGFVIEVADDGRGIDWPRLRARARALGQPIHRDVPEDLLFLDGVSSREQPTDVSGRGSGMPAVKAAVENQGGTVHVTSVEGKGTRFIFSFPWLVPHGSASRLVPA